MLLDAKGLAQEEETGHVPARGDTRSDAVIPRQCDEGNVDAVVDGGHAAGRAMAARGVLKNLDLDVGILMARDLFQLVGRMLGGVSDCQGNWLVTRVAPVHDDPRCRRSSVRPATGPAATTARRSVLAQAGGGPVTPPGVRDNLTGVSATVRTDARVLTPTSIRLACTCGCAAAELCRQGTAGKPIASNSASHGSGFLTKRLDENGLQLRMALSAQVRQVKARSSISSAGRW